MDPVVHRVARRHVAGFNEFDDNDNGEEDRGVRSSGCTITTGYVQWMLGFAVIQVDDLRFYGEPTEESLVHFRATSSSDARPIHGTLRVQLRVDDDGTSVFVNPGLEYRW